MKRYPLLAALLVALLFVSGCGLGIGLESNQEPPERLDVSQWPTVQPSPAPATATPFPKSQFTPTPEPALTSSTEATPTPAPASAETGPTGGLDLASLLNQLGDSDQVAALLEQLNAGGDLNQLLEQLPEGSAAADLLEQLSSQSDPAALLAEFDLDASPDEAANPVGAILKSGLSPVAVALVTAEETTIRRRPASNAAAAATVEKGELGGVLGTDSSGQWLYMVTINRLQGWFPLEDLRITGSLEEARVLPPDPLGAALARLAGQSGAAPASAAGQSSTGSTAGAGSAADSPVPFDQLPAVATAQVTSSQLSMRQRPGPSYTRLDTLPQDTELAVLGINRDQEWALIKTPTGQHGWVSTDYLQVDGSLADAPELRTLEPDTTTAAAPVVLVSGDLAESPATASSTQASSSAAQPAPASTTNPAVPRGNTLAPLTTALGSQKVDIRRGPALSYGASGELTVDEPVEVLAVNQNGDWAVVRTPIGETGWVALSNLKLEGSLAGAPAVTTGWIESNEVEIKSGPGIYYGAVGKLPIQAMVSVLGLSPQRSWALVEATNGGRGWIPLRLIDVAGSLATLPEVEGLPLAQTQPAGPALPQPSGPPSGTLVFQTSSGGQIMVIDADGSGLRPLTYGIDPVLSPDGRRVAFTRWVGDIGELWVIDIDGTNERQILGQMRKAKGPAWSPDGSQIVLNFQHGGRLDIDTVCKGSGSRPPRNAFNIRPRFDDGEVEICWDLPPDPQWSLRVIDVADGSFEDLYGGLYAFRPAWDPDQPWRIVSDAGNGLLAVSVDEPDERRQLTEVVSDGGPVFSPNGDLIALVTDVQNGHDIYRINDDGQGRVRLTETPLWVPVQPDSNGRQWNNVSPAWSPDGSRIAFLTDRTGRWEIWVMNADGSEPRPLFPAAVNDQLQIEYNFVDERVLSWQ